MLRTGNNGTRAFTLVEVLAAVVVLSIGIVGVIRAYVTLAGGIEASRFSVEASYLLKEKAADVEQDAIENLGVPQGAARGAFGGDYVSYRWETESSEVKVEATKPKEKPAAAVNAAAPVNATVSEAPLETLSKVRISVTSGSAVSPKKLSLYTYFENYPE